MRPSFLYRFLKIYCGIGLWFYFRKWQVAGADKVASEGPMIYIANHQSAFIDAILMTCSASRNPYYLARANVFKKKWIAQLLSLIRIKPIYRFRDGFGTLKNNDAVLQECVDLLKKGETILMFPEGNHNEPWSARAFQKGFARMALLYLQQTQDDTLRIAPIGIHYTQHEQFNGRVLVNFGEPLSLQSLMKAGASERENLDIITTRCGAALRELVLTIEPESEYEPRKLHFLKNRVTCSDMVQQLRSDRDTVAHYPKTSNTRNQQTLFTHLLRWPFVVWTYLTHAPLYWTIRLIIKRAIKDSQFISSVKYVLGIFTTPVYYTFITLVFLMISKNFFSSIYFLALLPLSLTAMTKLDKTRI
jgi:1-acyl-sn-glycerol-3-phosphate acyltransferase